MQIEVKGRNVSVTEDLREHVEKRFQKVARQVSELARLEIELSHERNPSNPEGQVVEATLSYPAFARILVRSRMFWS